MFRIICFLIGYFIGCIQTSYLVSKYVYKIDIRDCGSGNAGTTNMLRTFGKKVGVIVFVVDILKAIAAYCICSIIFNGSGTFNLGDSYLPGLYGGIGVIIGHNFPFYMKFKGGKGVASFLGMLLVFNFQLAIIIYLFGFIMALWFRYISLSSLVMLAAFPILILIFNMELEIILLAIFLCVITYIRHFENIKRLINKTELKFKGGKDR